MPPPRTALCHPYRNTGNGPLLNVDQRMMNHFGCTKMGKTRNSPGYFEPTSVSPRQAVFLLEVEINFSTLY